MAQATAFKTYNTTSDREDLHDVITNISPLETPMFSGFKKVEAMDTYKEWLIESLASATTNAQIEGADYSFSALTDRTRTGNYTQILWKTFEVSDSQRAANLAGIADEYRRRMENAMKELARDIEYALVNGTGNSGASGTARSLKGVLSFITTNVETGTGTGSEALTETMYNDLLQTIWNSGGRPDTTYVNGFQKRKISAFSTNTRNVAAKDNELYAAVDVYYSNFGVQTIVLDRYMTTSVVAVLEKDRWAVATYRPTKNIEVAKVGSATRGAVETELTLVAFNEASSGKITGLSTS